VRCRVGGPGSDALDARAKRDSRKGKSAHGQVVPLRWGTSGLVGSPLALGPDEQLLASQITDGLHHDGLWEHRNLL
jgi:hypothetical protein